MGYGRGRLHPGSSVHLPTVLRGQLNQCQTVDWLGGEIVASGFKTLLTIAGHRMGRERDDRPGISNLPQLSRRVVPVEHGHLHVHEDHIERIVF